MSKRSEYVGKKFGRLVVRSLSGVNKQGNTVWHCVCECGKELDVAAGRLQSGTTKSCGCLNHGPTSNAWKGGRIVRRNGYVLVANPVHPHTRKDKYVLEHLVVMSNYLGRPLRKGESVHHKNGIRSDNRIENLELFTSQHPSGQRVEDMIEFCGEYLRQYAPHLLK